MCVLHWYRYINELVTGVQNFERKLTYGLGCGVQNFEHKHASAHEDWVVVFVVAVVVSH